MIRRSRMLSRNELRCIREAIPHSSKYQPVVPPETFTAANRLQQKERQEKTLTHGSATRAEAYLATTITAPVGRNHGTFRGVVHSTRPQRETSDEGRLTEWLNFNTKRSLGLTPLCGSLFVTGIGSRPQDARDGSGRGLLPLVLDGGRVLQVLHDHAILLGLGL
jgi:hypothetical protein